MLSIPTAGGDERRVPSAIKAVRLWQRQARSGTTKDRNAFWLRRSEGRCEMDDLIRDLVDRAGLSEEQARAAAEVVVDWVNDEDKRKKILAALATTIASAVVTVPI
jgi:hypothetical protein